MKDDKSKTHWGDTDFGGLAGVALVCFALAWAVNGIAGCAAKVAEASAPAKVEATDK